MITSVVSCYDCDWKNEYEELEFTPTVCPACGGDVELEEFQEQVALEEL